MKCGEIFSYTLLAAAALKAKVIAQTVFAQHAPSAVFCIIEARTALIAVHLFIYGTFKAQLAFCAVVAYAIGALLTVYTVWIATTEADLAAIAAMISKVHGTFHTVVSAIFAYIYAVFAQTTFMA